MSATYVQARLRSNPPQTPDQHTSLGVLYGLV